MDARTRPLAQQLLLIERQLRLQNMWKDTAPAPEALASCEPFCVDTLQFEEWLQWIFLPRMKAMLESDAPLPAASGIRAMAEMVYGEQPQMNELLEALGTFDELIMASS